MAATACAQTAEPAPSADAKASAPAAPAVSLSAPAMTPPLSLNATPFSVDGGVFGKLYISGQVTGLGLVQSDATPNPLPHAGNSDSLADISNAQVQIQTIDGPLQIFLQVGAYTFPTLGTGYIRAGTTNSTYFGPVPVAYAKFVATPEISFQVGALPTLIGSEYAFTFQNMNIERGLLWNQEPVISKGAQANYAKGPLSVSVSINDGYYSDHYNWLSGLASYAINGSNTIAVNGGFNFASTNTNKFRAPNSLNNSGIFDLSYTYTQGPIYVNAYFQYTRVSATPYAGVFKDAETYSGAVLAKYSFTPEWSLAGRAEYISSSSDACTLGDAAGCAPTSVLYGPGSDAFSLTLTPTWKKGVLFARGEVSYTRIENFQPGFGFDADFKRARPGPRPDRDRRAVLTRGEVLA